MATNRIPYCSSREVIMTKLALSDGFYFEESHFHGKTYETISHAVDSLTMDHAAEYLRFDLDTLTAENITEEFAAEWLEKFDGTPEDEDRHLPLYVRGSEAWDAWCEQYHIDKGMAFTQRSHGTLNHRQQFGR